MSGLALNQSQSLSGYLNQSSLSAQGVQRVLTESHIRVTEHRYSHDFVQSPQTASQANPQILDSSPKRED